MRTLEWQVAEGSDNAHVIDLTRPGGRRTGPKALCGRYPQRMRGWWFGLNVDETGVMRALATYRAVVCRECRDALAARPDTTEGETP